MAEIHALAARIVLVLVLLIAAWSVVLAAGRRPIGPALLGGLAWIVVLVAATGLLGVISAVFTGSGWPTDPLHIVYGILAALVLPGAWVIARASSDSRRTVLVLAVALIVQVILVVRLFQTGG